jgi:hypothetical protein
MRCGLGISLVDGLAATVGYGRRQRTLAPDDAGVYTVSL